MTSPSVTNRLGGVMAISLAAARNPVNMARLSMGLEQLAFSALQLSLPVLALVLADAESLGWTAAFTACLGLVVAVMRGVVIQPALVRGAESKATLFNGRALLAVSMVSVSVLVSLGEQGAFQTGRALVALALAAPAIGIVEIGRAVERSSVGQQRTARLVFVMLAVLVLAHFLPAVREDPRPALLGWVSIWWLLAAVTSVRIWPSITWGRADNGPWISLTANNLLGQFSMQGAILVLALTLSATELAVLQAARIPMRPVVILGAALPVHYLPSLLNSPPQHSRARRAHRSSLMVLGLAAAGVSATTLAILVIRPFFATFGQVPAWLFAGAAVATAASVAEATANTRAIADGRQAHAARARVVALVALAAAAMAVSVIGLAGLGGAVVLLLLAPVIVVVALGRL